MYTDKEYGRKLGFFYKEIMEYLHAPDDGTLAKNLLSDHPDLDKEYVKKLADKGCYIKKLKNLIDIDAECFVNAQVNIQPRLYFDVAEFVTNSYSLCNEKEKVINIYLFSEKVDEKLAIETLNEFNNIGLVGKTFIVFRNQLLGLSKNLDLYLNDYVSYYTKINISENVLKVNPSRLSFALGAGCSIDANIGSWQQLNDALSFELLASDDNYGLTNYGSKEVNESVLKELSKNFDKNSLIDIAVRKKRESEDKTTTYFNYVHDILYMNYDESKLDYKTKTLISISNCIKRIKMENVITYNFDSTLEKNVNDDYHSDTSDIKASMTTVNYESGEVHIFHVHGYIPYDYDKTTIVSDFILSDTDYFLNSFKSEGQPNAIQNELFSENDIVFVGCSFNDSNIKQILSSLDKNRSNRIYALMKVPTFSELVNAHKQKELEVSIIKYKMLLNNYLGYYGVKPIWINDFKDISTIIDSIVYNENDIEINVDSLFK